LFRHQRESNMTEEKKEPWLNQMALATVILAVCATFSAFKGGGYSTLSVISQAMASDQWSFYQAKSTKQHLHEIEADHLKLEAMTLQPGSPAATAYAEKIKEYETTATRYDVEKKEIEAKAKELENQRDDAKKHGKPFSLAIIFLQVAILLNSIAGLMKVKQMWWASIPVGLVGIAFFINGFFSIF